MNATRRQSEPCHCTRAPRLACAALPSARVQRSGVGCDPHLRNAVYGALIALVPPFGGGRGCIATACSAPAAAPRPRWRRRAGTPAARASATASSAHFIHVLSGRMASCDAAAEAARRAVRRATSCAELAATHSRRGGSATSAAVRCASATPCWTMRHASTHAVFVNACGLCVVCAHQNRSFFLRSDICFQGGSLLNASTSMPKRRWKSARCRCCSRRAGSTS